MSVRGYALRGTFRPAADQACHIPGVFDFRENLVLVAYFSTGGPSNKPAPAHRSSSQNLNLSRGLTIYFARPSDGGTQVVTDIIVYSVHQHVVTISKEVFLSSEPCELADARGQRKLVRYKLASNPRPRDNSIEFTLSAQPEPAISKGRHHLAVASWKLGTIELNSRSERLSGQQQPSYIDFYPSFQSTGGEWGYSYGSETHTSMVIMKALGREDISLDVGER